MKVLYVGLRDPRHSSAGGYDWITRYPGSKTLWDYQALFSFLKPNQRGKRINLFFQDLKARRMAKEYDIVHYFYGDNLKREFPSKRNYKVVATVHMDVTKKHNKEKFLKILQSLDGVIVLSSSQKVFLEEMGIRAAFIPHGFNQPKFNKVDTGINNESINIVVSGSNYRDIDTLYNSISYCAQNRQDVFFHLLGQPGGVKEMFSPFNNVKCYPRLDDDLYYSVISDCDYSFLPLTFATANNALLEAQFLGVKSILPLISGIDDYAASAPLNYYYKAQDDLNKIFNNISKNKIDSRLSCYSEKFQWVNIYEQLQEYYECL